MESLKWIHILTTVLALTSMGVILLTILLILLTNSILSHAGGQFSTITGFIASLITLPTAFKIKTYYSATQFDKLKKYDVDNYHRFILIVSSLVQIIAIIVCFISMVLSKNAKKSFTKAMSNYLESKSLSSKKYIDNVQFNFQCCGWEYYQEWLGPNCEQKSVPFSCCKILILEKCTHYNITKFGIRTICKTGCGKKLKIFVLSVLITELILYLFILALLFLLLRKKKDDIDNTFVINKNGSNKKRKWDNFINTSSNKKKSKNNSPASIKPSAMDTLIVKKK